MKNLTIVGGGTAGWLTALYAKKTFPESNIILIKSQDIGILGAGEATTPHIINLIKFLDIDIVEIFKECNATVKNAIKFTNWNPNNYYFHGFSEPSMIQTHNSINFVNDFLEPPIEFSFLYAKNNNIDNYKILCSHHFSKNCATPFSKENANDKNKLFNTFIGWALHFDANLFAKYLEKVGSTRGIKIINTSVKGFETNDDGDIKKLILANGKNQETDFVFDASGFARLIIGKFYKSKWISYKQYLPVKRAIPFSMPLANDKLESYTECVAMDYGWMWKIPLQNRYGCGYVYDSDHITSQQAVEEIENFTGKKIEYQKEFSFEPGTYKEVWIKNCLAVGLSAGFIEPLESTSIMQTIRILQRFMSNKNNLYCKDKKVKNYYNELIVDDSVEVMEFIYFHYVTKKKNTSFWRNFTKNNKMPVFIKELLHQIKFTIPSFYDMKKFRTFGYQNYINILFGNDLVDQNVCNKFACFSSKKEYMDRRINEIEMIQHVLMDHKEFISKVKELT